MGSVEVVQIPPQPLFVILKMNLQILLLHLNSSLTTSLDLVGRGINQQFFLCTYPCNVATWS